MLLRFAVFAMMALGLGGFGVVTWLAMRTPAVEVAASATAPVVAPVPHFQILSAAAPLRAGTLLKPDDLQARDVTELPAGAQADTAAARAALMGGMLRRSLSGSDPVLVSDVMRPGDHGFLAAVLAPGFRAASVAVDAVSGSAGLIWPGDHVDLILTQALDDPALPPAHRIAAETVLSDIRVIAIDQLLAHGVAPSSDTASVGRTVTLEVSPDNAARVAVATRLGRLSLAVRAAEGAIAPEPPKLLTTWGGDVSPALGKPAPPVAAAATLRLYQGNADGKEFRF